MNRNARFAALASVAAALCTSTGAKAGAPGIYDEARPVEPPAAISTFTAAAPAAPMQPTYYDPAPTPAPVRPKDGYYDERYGGNAEFGYEPSYACGGRLDGERCLVILNDHMRRVRIDRPAGTILVGNPTIADVTVLGSDTLFVSARSIGSTNIIVLDKQGDEVVTYEVFVREPRTKRVTVRHGLQSEHYQCAPYCERALTQSDTPAQHSATVGVIGADLGLDARAIGLQSGDNPNNAPAARAAEAAAAAAASPRPGSGEGIARAVGALSEATAGPAGTFLGAGAGAAPAAPPAPAPIRSEPMSEPMQ